MRATPILLASLLLAGAAQASPLGEWVTEGDKARVRIEPCADQPDRLCGAITWSYRPPDAPQDGPLLDVNNSDPKLRSRPIVGLPLLQGFKSAGEGRWDGGTIYDPEGGKTYRSKMRLESEDLLKVEGCVLVFCRAQDWRRYRGG